MSRGRLQSGYRSFVVCREADFAHSSRPARGANPLLVLETTHTIVILKSHLEGKRIIGDCAVHSLLRLEGRRCRQLPAVSLLPANLQCPSMTIHGFVDSGCCDIAFIQCRQPVHLPRKHQRCIKKVKIWLHGWTLAASSSYGVGTDNLHCFLTTQWPSASN